MKRINFSLKNAFNMLVEQEEKQDNADQETDETNKASEDTDETETDASDDEEQEDVQVSDDETDEDQTEDAEDPKEKITQEDQYKLSDSIDAELEALIIDYEKEARKSAEINKPMTELSIKQYKRFLFENDQIDLRNFSSNIARFIKNYTNLIDWPEVILNKAEIFITTQYGDDTGRRFIDIMDDEYDIRRKSDKEELTSTPVAVGARETS